jgi:hypothetical protein
VAWRQSPVNFNHVGFCEKTLSPGFPANRLATQELLQPALGNVDLFSDLGQRQKVDHLFYPA